MDRGPVHRDKIVRSSRKFDRAIIQWNLLNNWATEDDHLLIQERRLEEAIDAALRSKTFEAR
jgi:hypothetical protein